jgi:Mrp family chromosome partitioning ATPase
MQDSDEPNIRRILDVIRRRGLWAVLCIVLAAGAAFGLSKHQTKKYTATASLLFNSNQLAQQIAGLSISVTGPAEQNNNVKLVAVGNVAAKTARRIGRGLTAQKIDESLSIAQQGETNIIGESSIVDLSSTMTSPSLAAEIANTYARLFVAEQRRSNRQYFTSALAIVTKQLAALPSSQRFSTAGVALQSRAQALSLLAELQYGGVQVANNAEIPTSASSPSAKKDTAIGAILGLLVGVALMLALERADRRVREPKDFESVYRAPLLGAIPESKSLRSKGQGALGQGLALSPAQVESFSLVLAHMRSFNRGRDLGAVLVTAVGAGDGATTIALGLAQTAARTGSRTLLLEVDLRQSGLARRLGIESGPGLQDVLSERVDVYQACRTLTFDGSGVGVQSLDVLVSGVAPESVSGALLDGRRMAALLSTVRSTYDLVIVDAPPIASVSDAFPLLGGVDGVVVVDAPGRNRRDAGEYLREILDKSAVPVLGVVANRAKSRASRRPAAPRGGGAGVAPAGPAGGGIAAPQEQRTVSSS